MSNDINIGAISEALNDKLDRNGLNAGNPCSVIIETYVDGTSGYRIWSDGYCEQWGHFSNNDTQEVTVTLLKTMANTDYFISKQVGVNGAFTSSWNAQYQDVYALTTTSFKTYTYASTGLNQFRWIACGYLADGEY